MGLWCIECSNANKNDFDSKKMICRRCKSNNIVNISGKMKVVDILTITSISKDKDFLKAMSDLYDTDIVEYQLKLSQFKKQTEMDENIRAQKTYQPRCPTCNSTNITPISFASKMLDTALFGNFGTERYKTFQCNNCGFKW